MTRSEKELLERTLESKAYLCVDIAHNWVQVDLEVEDEAVKLMNWEVGELYVLHTLYQIVHAVEDLKKGVPPDEMHGV